MATGGFYDDRPQQKTYGDFRIYELRAGAMRKPNYGNKGYKHKTFEDAQEAAVEFAKKTRVRDVPQYLILKYGGRNQAVIVGILDNKDYE